MNEGWSHRLCGWSHFILYLIIGYSAVTIIADLEGLLIEQIYVEILELIRLPGGETAMQ